MGNGGCADEPEGGCLNTEGSYQCYCNDGYKLDIMGKRKCWDVDECAKVDFKITSPKNLLELIISIFNFFGINFEINQRTTAVVIKYAQIQKDPIIADVELVIISTMMIIHVLMLTSVTVTATIRN